LILILAHVVVHLDHKKFKSNEIQFSHWLLPVVFETMNSRTRGSMHFVETTEIVANDKNIFTVMRTACIIISVVNILWSMSLQIYYKSAKLKFVFAKMVSRATTSTSLFIENALISIVYPGKSASFNFWSSVKVLLSRVRSRYVKCFSLLAISQCSQIMGITQFCFESSYCTISAWYSHHLLLIKWSVRIKITL
jgi:hypothetical protein